MRYFLVTYATEKAMWNIETVTSPDFINNLRFQASVKKAYPEIKDVIITNIFEFKSEEDFNSFIKR